jgi:hypothetical protein
VYPTSSALFLYYILAVSALRGNDWLFVLTLFKFDYKRLRFSTVAEVRRKYFGLGSFEVWLADRPYIKLGTA